MKKFLIWASLILTTQAHALSENRYQKYESTKVTGEICNSITEQLSGQMSQWSNSEEYKTYYKTEEIQSKMHASAIKLQDDVLPLCTKPGLTVGKYLDEVKSICKIDCSRTVSTVKDTLFNSSNKKAALEGCEKLCRKLDDTIGMYFIGYIDGNVSTKTSKTPNADCSGVVQSTSRNPKIKSLESDIEKIGNTISK